MFKEVFKDWLKEGDAGGGEKKTLTRLRRGVEAATASKGARKKRAAYLEAGI